MHITCTYQILWETVRSIKIRNETEDEDMDQDTPHSDKSHDQESESASGTENEEDSFKSHYYRLQSESNEMSQRKVIAYHVEKNKVKLNAKQIQVYEEVWRSENNEEGRIYFLDAPRGTLVRGVKGWKTTVSGN